MDGFDECAQFQNECANFYNLGPDIDNEHLQ